jgi:hypothetical protein
MSLKLLRHGVRVRPSESDKPRPFHYILKLKLLILRSNSNQTRISCGGPYRDWQIETVCAPRRWLPSRSHHHQNRLFKSQTALGQWDPATLVLLDHPDTLDLPVALKVNQNRPVLRRVTSRRGLRHRPSTPGFLARAIGP